MRKKIIMYMGFYENKYKSTLKLIIDKRTNTYFFQELIKDFYMKIMNEEMKTLNELMKKLKKI